MENTRAALRACAALEAAGSGRNKEVKFGDLFEYTDGQIANLNRVLQNLKKSKEIEFKVEIFFEGQHNDELITLKAAFWDQKYTINAENVFRPGRNMKDVPQEQRKGRSYESENLASSQVEKCFLCGEFVPALARVTIRGNVYHLVCIQCSVCSAQLREKADYVTFDGSVCCSSECVRSYDASHTRQPRG